MKTHQHDSNLDPDMLPEYDFSGKKGVRGKYYQAYRQGHTVRITQEDGTVTTQYFTLEDGAVFLSPDVRKYFPDSDSVNQALRGLIKLIPQETPEVVQLSYRMGLRSVCSSDEAVVRYDLASDISITPANIHSC